MTSQQRYPNLSLIAAVANHGVIGSDNQLPWHLPEDLKHFKSLTTGHDVIMGGHTWRSLPAQFRPLPYRQNIILSNSIHDKRIIVKHSLEDVLAMIEKNPERSFFIIGGGTLYHQTIDLATTLIITQVFLSCKGDIFFPVIDEKQWHLESKSEQLTSSTGIKYQFLFYRALLGSATQST